MAMVSPIFFPVRSLLTRNTIPGFFQVLPGKAGCTFGSTEFLRSNSGAPLILPENENHETISTRPTAADWNNDGKVDLVVGNKAGTLYLFEGKGGGHFDPHPTQIMTDSAPLKVTGGGSDPCLIDWDGDGDLDIVSGSNNGGVQWSENTGSKEAAEMLPFVYLIPVLENPMLGEIVREQDVTGPGVRTRVEVADLNADGLLDIVVGDHTCLRFPAPGISDSEFVSLINQASQEYARKMREHHDDASEREKIHKEHGKEINRIQNYEHVGFVWLFLGK